MGTANDNRQQRRVACVYHFYAHYREAVLEELTRSSQHDWTFFGSPESVVPSIKKWTPSEQVRFRALRTYCFGPLLFQFGLLKIALSREFQDLVLLGNSSWPTTWIAAILGRLSGKRVYFWTHGWIHKESGLKGAFRNTFYRLAHGLLLYGHVAKSIGIASGFPEGKLHVIYNSLDYESQRRARSEIVEEDLTALRQELFPDSNAPVAVCVTRLTEVRRLDQLIEALKVLKDQGNEWNLLLVGDGPEKERLQQISKSLGIQTCFYGACYDNDKLAELVAASNVTIAPGKIGLSAMTSLAYGTPVITHNDADNQMPEWESIIDGFNGGLFERNNIDDLADKIQQWSNLPSSREELTHVCQAVLERFYNPKFQVKCIDRAISGNDAHDLFWLLPKEQ